MLIWAGFGWVVPLGMVASVFGVSGVFSLLGQGPGAPLHEYEPVCALLLSSLTAHLGEEALARSRRPRRLLDLDTREEVVLIRQDSFMLVPVRWWSSVFLLLAAVMAGRILLR